MSLAWDGVWMRVCICSRVFAKGSAVRLSLRTAACVCESSRWAECVWHAHGLCMWGCPVHTRSPQPVLNTLWTAH